MDLRDCLFDRRVKFLCFGDKQPSLANYRDAFGGHEKMWWGRFRGSKLPCRAMVLGQEDVGNQKIMCDQCRTLIEGLFYIETSIAYCAWR